MKAKDKAYDLIDKMYKILERTEGLNSKTHDEVLEAIEETTAEIRKSIKLIK